MKMLLFEVRAVIVLFRFVAVGRSVPSEVADHLLVWASHVLFRWVNSIILLPPVPRLTGLCPQWPARRGHGLTPGRWHVGCRFPVLDVDGSRASLEV